MDPILIEKFKQDFENERREQVIKGKDLQKETMQRRRQMELKAQLEAAKEEKRRQEALAERKARHIEATMRFQKGLKHFKFNKEKISLEQVLRDITPQRSRLNSADDTDRTAASNFSAYNNYIEPNFYNPSKLVNNSNNNNTRTQMNRLRKSSSFESLSSLVNSNANNNNNNNTNKKPFVHNNTNYMNSNHNNAKLNINSSNQHIIVEPLKLNHMNQSNIPQHLNAYNPETLIENTNFKIINNHQTKNIVYSPSGSTTTTTQNQFRNHSADNDLTRDHLKEFQNLVANELNNKQQQFTQQPNKIVKPNPHQTFYDTTNILTIEDYRNGIHNQQFNRQTLDDLDDNSMETDSLLNMKIDSPESTKKSMTSKIDGENDIDDEILFINNNITKKKEPFKNQLNTNYNSHVDASNLWFSNSNMTTGSKIKTQNQKNSQGLSHVQNQQHNHSQHQSHQQNAQASYNGNRNNSLGSIKENTTTKEIKSILKRSSSLENNSTAATTAQQAGVNFALKPSSDSNVKNTGVKDSIELANMRLRKEDSIAESTSNKKSVRFASHLNDCNNDGAQHQADSNNSNNTNVNNSNNNNSINNNSNQTEVKQTTQTSSTSQNAEDQRISSTNSIRRPVIKPRNTIVNSYNRSGPNSKNDVDIVTTTTIVNSPKFLNHTNHVANHKIDEFIVNSEKPPAHPNTYLLSGGSSSSGSSSYSLIGQKRRELLQQRNKLNSGGSSSCSSSAGTASVSGSSGLNDRISYLNSPKTNNGISIKIDVTPSLQQHYAASNNNPNTINNTNNHTVLPLNRIALTSPSPLQSPNTFFPMPISNSSQSSSSFTNSNNSNNNFTNLKYVEGNYRDYQLSKNKEQQQQQPNKNAPSNDSIRLNNNTMIDMSLYKKLDISNYLDQQHQLNQMINRELYANNNNVNKPVENQQTNITRIPLSPKSNLKPNNYYHPNNENLLNNKPVFNNTSAPEQIILRRPAVTTDNTNGNNQMSFTSKPPTPSNANHTPNATVTQLSSPAPIVINNSSNNSNMINNNNIPKTNIRFAYINSPLSSHNPNNQTNYYNESQIKSGNPSSAESISNGKIPNSAPIHLEIKYPLYSNHQTQNTQFINISKPINKQPSLESDPNQRGGIPVSISIEEQNVKNSIARLNERLNMINNQKQFSTDYINRGNYDINKQKQTNRPIVTTNGAKIRR